MRKMERSQLRGKSHAIEQTYPCVIGKIDVFRAMDPLLGDFPFFTRTLSTEGGQRSWSDTEQHLGGLWGCSKKQGQWISDETSCREVCIVTTSLCYPSLNSMSQQ